MATSIRLVCLIGTVLAAAAWAVDPHAEHRPAVPTETPLEEQLAPLLQPPAAVAPDADGPGAAVASLTRFAGTPTHHWAFYNALHDAPSEPPLAP